MTDTVVSSSTREVVIGFERPFVIIGERINPTGRKLLAAEMAAGNFERVKTDVMAQVEAGAHMLDVNAGIPLADEPAILARTKSATMSACKSENVSTRSGLSARIFGTSAEMKADTRGFSLRTRAGRTA